MTTQAKSRTKAGDETKTGRITIKRAVIKNYMGIECLELDVPAAGAVFAGKNGAGKTSTITAIKAALTGKGVDASAIRTGAKRSEILLDLADVTVRRLITPGGSSLTVSDARSTMKSPQAYLNALLGGSPIDPLVLWAERDAKKRRALILSAVPATVTAAQIKGWCPGVSTGWVAATLGGIPITGDDVPLPGHGLEVIAAVRAAYYSSRAQANAEVTTRDEDLRRAVEQLHAVEGEVGADPWLTVEDAQAALDATRTEARTLFERVQTVEAWEKRSAATRRRVEALQEQARARRETQRSAPPAEVIAAKEDELEGERLLVRQAEDEIRRVEALLTQAKERFAEVRDRCNGVGEELDALDAKRADAAADEAAITGIEAQARDLEQAIGEPPPGVSQDQADELQARQARAEAELQRARKGCVVTRQRETVTALRDVAGQAAEKATALTEVVDRLTHQAPTELLAGTDAIPGLAVEGDDILLDGVSLDRLCGAERLRFAVDIARRMSRCGLLIVDGLEVLDPEQLGVFVEAATRDGFQLLATRVAAGDPVVEPIEVGP